MANTKVPVELSSTPSIVDNGNATAITIDSSENVGIGGSPTNYSDHKTLSLYGNTGTGAGFIEFNDTLGNANAVIFSDDGNLFINADYDNTAASSSIRFRVDGSSEKMRIDASGNVGIGAKLYSNSPVSTLGGFQFYRDHTNGDCFVFDTTTAPYAGDLIFGTTNTERMRIDSSGRVGIGTDSPQSATKGIHVVHDATEGSPTFTGAEVGIFQRNFNNAQGAAISIVGGSNSESTVNFADKDDANVGQINYSHSSNAMLFRVNDAERMRISSNGSIGVGTTDSTYSMSIQNIVSSDVMLQIKNTTANEDTGIFIDAVQGGAATNSRIGHSVVAGNNLLQITNPNGHAFYTGTSSLTEAMRIDSSGTFILGKTSDDFDTAGFHVIGAGAVYSGIQTQSASSSYHLRDTTNNTWEFYVTGAGQIHATSTSITSLSDERLKENIEDLETGLTEVMSLKPRRFDWKDREQKNIAGFIAQEVETVLPDLVSDFMHDDLEDAKSVKMGDMIPTLVKAIQEQQELINNLTARIEQLEN